MANLFGLSDAEFYSWVILPLLIFLARVVDVTLQTMRIIFTSRGKRKLAPILGFFEVLIWVVALGQLVQNLSSATSYLGYAAGFAAGNYVGMFIEERLAIGTLMVRSIIGAGSEEILQRLRQAGFGATEVEGCGAAGPVKVIYTAVPRKNLRQVTDIIHAVHPHAFVTIEDLRSTEAGVFPIQAEEKSRRFGERTGK